MDDEVPEAGLGGRGSYARQRSYPRDLRDTRREDHEGTCIERSRAPSGFDTAASNHQPAAAMAEGEDRAQNHAGVPAHQEALLGTTHVGTRLLLLQHWKCDDEIIAEYIAHQHDDRDDDFKVDG